LTQAFQLVLDKKMEMVNVRVAAGDYSDTDTSIEIPAQVRQIEGSGKNVTFIGNNIIIKNSVDITDITIGNDPNEIALSIDLDTSATPENVVASKSFTKLSKIVSFFNVGLIGSFLAKLKSKVQSFREEEYNNKFDSSPKDVIYNTKDKQVSFAEVEQQTSRSNELIADAGVAAGNFKPVAKFNGVTAQYIVGDALRQLHGALIPWLKAKVEKGSGFSFSSSNTKHTNFQNLMQLINDGGKANVSIGNAVLTTEDAFTAKRRISKAGDVGPAAIDSASMDGAETNMTFNDLMASPVYSVANVETDDKSPHTLVATNSTAGYLGTLSGGNTPQCCTDRTSTGVCLNYCCVSTISNSSFIAAPEDEAADGTTTKSLETAPTNTFKNASCNMNGCEMTGQNINSEGSVLQCSDCSMANCPMECSKSQTRLNSVSHSSKEKPNVTMKNGSTLDINGSTLENTGGFPVVLHEGGTHTTNLTQSSLSSDGEAVVMYLDGEGDGEDEISELGAGSLSTTGRYGAFAKSTGSSPVLFAAGTNQNLLGSSQVLGNIKLGNTENAFKQRGFLDDEGLEPKKDD
jgi:hypothetical protein